MKTSVEVLSPEDVCLFIQEEIPTLFNDILQKIVDHKIYGEVFLSLNDEHFREIALSWGRALAAALAKVSTGLS